MKLEHLPLSRDTRTVYPAFVEKINNPGLIFDRYIAYWEDWTLEPKRKMKPPNPKFDTLDRIAHVPCDARLLAALSERQRQLFQSCGAIPFQAHPDWRFITGLGSHSPLEVGFTFHRLYGIPIIAGSSLKGLTRAYAEYALLPDQKTTKEEIEIIFGKPDAAGTAVFFDALPVKLPSEPPYLELDVMNPHYPEWYQEGKAPANWQNPIPVFFLTVGKEAVFRFAVGGRGKDGALAKEKARAWLEEALREMGAGAKTSAGYGYFSDSELVAPAPQKTRQITVPSQTGETSARHRHQPTRGRTKQRADSPPSLRPEQIKADAEAQKKAAKMLKQTEKEKSSQAAQPQTTYSNNATEPKAQVEQSADGTWLVILPKLPQQKPPLKAKTQFSNAAAGAKIRVRVIVDKKGNVVRAEEL